MLRRNLFCLTLLTSLALFCPTFIQAAVANNPGIAIAGGISGKDVLCTGSTSTYNATLEWPPGVSHPVAGKYTWSASPLGNLTINGTQGPVIDASSLDIDLVTIGGAKKGPVTLTVQWKADSGNYSMPSASKKICVIDPVAAPSAVAALTCTRSATGTEGNFGLTTRHTATLDIGTYTDCANLKWKLKVTRADLDTGFGIDMLGRSEASVAAATAANWHTMSEDIAPIEQARQWYMRAAIVAHEEVHAGNWEAIMRTNFIVFQATVEALTIDMTCDVDTAAKAKAAFLALPAYTAAVTALDADSEAQFQPYRHPAVDPLTTAAEQMVLQPVYLGILIKAAQNGWP